MTIEIRVYRRYDVDIFSLYDAGYPVSAMVKDALIAYAHAKPFKIAISENVPFVFTDKQKTVIHSRIKIPDEDTETIYMLTHIKPMLRNNFCKMIFRNCLVSQNVCGFFTETPLCNTYVKNLNNSSMNVDGITPINSYKKTIRKVKFLNKEVVETNRETKPLFNTKTNIGINSDPDYNSRNTVENIVKSEQPVPYTDIEDNNGNDDFLELFDAL